MHRIRSSGRFPFFPVFLVVVVVVVVVVMVLESLVVGQEPTLRFAEQCCRSNLPQIFTAAIQEVSESTNCKPICSAFAACASGSLRGGYQIGDNCNPVCQAELSSFLQSFPKSIRSLTLLKCLQDEDRNYDATKEGAMKVLFQAFRSTCCAKLDRLQCAFLKSNAYLERPFFKNLKVK